jgi:3-oxoacyl-[acyl-carrier-protein] synthase-3
MRSDEQLFMNGMEIFKFSSTDVVKSLARFMEAGNLTPDNVDCLFLHQANKFMNDKIAAKLGFPEQKVPYSIGSYGNTGSASIPLTIAHHLSGARPSGQVRGLLCGFGVGLSWGMVDVTLSDIHVPPIVECGEHVLASGVMAGPS